MANSIKSTQLKNVHNLVLAAMFTAIVILLQSFGAVIKLGVFSVSLVLIPIAVGAAVCGPLVGAWLGFVFGATVLLSGDAAWFLEYTVPGTIIVVLVKGILAGFCSGYVYKLLANRNKTLAGIGAAVVCPIVNTGVFTAGCFIFFKGLINDTMAGAGFSGSTMAYIIAFFIGWNFIFEFLLNAVASPVIVRLINLALKRRRY